MASYPFLETTFFQALERCGATTPETGWSACHVEKPDAWLPLYRRSHSRGEYVFDFSWADAYQRHGLAYYPKLVTSVPFTPVVGPRWRGAWAAQELWQTVSEQMEVQQASGWHLLFPDQPTREALEELPLVSRQACHFRWFNRRYSDFEDFLSTFQSRKRKNVRKERRRILEQGIRIERRRGAHIQADDWALFYQCYASTYLKRGQMPYLNEVFFAQIAERQGEQLMMVLARDENSQAPLAAALYFFDDKQLYGRYWGCVQERDCLHFEMCYYQGIEFAIEQQLQEFDPGVQGEHKILRGFEPVITWSLHHLREPAFQQAIRDFCQEEALHVQGYQQEARSLLPFRRGD